jgi:hypothetical protein
MNRARFLATVDIDGWRLKTYAITPGDGRPRGELVAAARRQAAATLPDRPDRVGAYGVGFLVIHDCATGHTACTALVDWWVQPDSLYQCVFTAPAGDPRALSPSTTAAIGGVHELAITAHEGQAWQRHVIANPAGRDIDGYLADVFHAPN